MENNATYTMRLAKVIEYYGEDEVKGWFMDYNLSDYLTAKEIAVIEERGTWTKEKLAQLIIDEYYMREIGLETPAYFKHRAKVLMRQIMESKAPLIYSASIEYDPLVNVDFSEHYEAEHEHEDHTHSTGNSSSNTSGLNVNSDTPQGEIHKNEILGGKYASSTGASEAEDHTNTTGDSNTDGNSSENYTKTIKGNSGISATAQKMIDQYRQNIRAINLEIVEEVAPLFMGVYNHINM